MTVSLKAGSNEKADMKQDAERDLTWLHYGQADCLHHDPADYWWMGQFSWPQSSESSEQVLHDLM